MSKELVEDPIERTPDEIMGEVMDKGFDSFYVGYSGGKDSGIVLDFISKNYPKQFKGVLYCDTGIGTKATMDFVKSWCKDHNYPLHILVATDVKRVRESKYGEIGDSFGFEAMVLNFGFPGVGNHNITMAQLKMYSIKKFCTARKKAGEKPIVISGVRRKESTRRSRRKSYRTYINADGSTWFCCPLYFKSNDWVMKYWITANIKRSPCYNTIHISGDCLCGCFAQEEELGLLKMFHPEVYEEIKRIEKLIPTKGTDAAKKWCTWGNHNKTTLGVEAQDDIEGMVCTECFHDQNQDESKASDTSYLREDIKPTITPKESESRRIKRELINKEFRERELGRKAGKKYQVGKVKKAFKESQKS